MRLPHISDVDLFESPDNNDKPLDIHRCLVIYGKHRFLVYGYIRAGADVNQAIWELRPTLNWTGEIVVFTLGRYVPFLSRPSATRKVIGDVVSRWVYIS